MTALPIAMPQPVRLQADARTSYPGLSSTRYRLAPALRLTETAAGGALVCDRPLAAIHLNRAGFSLARGLSDPKGRTVAELAADGDASPTRVAAFLESLENRRLVVREPAAPIRWPSVTAVIAARGRPAATRACVISLLALDYPPDRLEIILVDDASEPPLAPAVAGLPIRVVRLDRNLGQSAARNIGAAEARGELLAFIDNDCVAAPAWLRELVPYFGDAALTVVGGRVQAPPSVGAVAAFEAVRSPLDMGAVAGPVGPDRAVAYLPTCNLLVRRDALLAERGFSTDMRVGEDVDFVWRILRGGGRAFYSRAGSVTHHHRVKLADLLRRRADYGASEADLQRRHPRHRSTLYLPRTGLIGLAALVAAAPFWPAAVALAAVAGAMVGAEALAKTRRLAQASITASRRRVLGAVVREHAASVYHFGRQVTRYHGLPLLAAGLVWPPLLAAVAVLLLAPPLCDHRRLKPGLPLPAFVVLHGLEMAAYQIGVWRGCRAERCWRPLLPRLRWRR